MKFRDAFDNPLRAGKGGRPSGTTGIVKYLVVVQEEHEGGEVHFHVALKLNTQRQFLPVKKTLRTRIDWQAIFRAATPSSGVLSGIASSQRCRSRR